MFGAGLALAAVGGIRIELNAQLGWSTSESSVPVEPAWSDGAQTYTAARWTARTALFELTGSRRAGSFELWAGGGVHVSWIQFEAEYDALRCRDLLCLTGADPVHDTEGNEGSGATSLLLSGGVRYPIFDHVLVGLDLRWLAPATSRIGDRFDVSARLGGFTASAGLTLRLGGRVPRALAYDPGA
jgi:hypothetical protein